MSRVAITKRSHAWTWWCLPIVCVTLLAGTWYLLAVKDSYDRFGVSIAVGHGLGPDQAAYILIGDSGVGPDRIGRISAVTSESRIPLFRLRGVKGASFGRQLAVIGDVDRDGCVDFCVLSEFDLGGAKAVRAFSGATGAPLWQVSIDGDEHLMVSAADHDGDGIGDFIVGHVEWWRGEMPGVVTVYSGANGHAIKRSNGHRPSRTLGWSIVSLGDCDLDGIADIGILEQASEGPHPEERIFNVLSGRDFRLLWTVNQGRAESRLALSASNAGDVNNDGADDVILAEPYTFVEGVGLCNRVMVLSGLDGSVLHSFEGRWGAYGEQVCGLGDLNGDGFSDFAIGSPDYDISSGLVDVHSGKTGEIIYSLFESGATASSRFYKFGMRIAAGEFDGDGVPDILVAAVCPGGCVSRGSVFAYSGASGHLINVWTRRDVGWKIW